MKKKQQTIRWYYAVTFLLPSQVVTSGTAPCVTVDGLPVPQIYQSACCSTAAVPLAPATAPPLPAVCTIGIGSFLYQIDEAYLAHDLEIKNIEAMIRDLSSPGVDYTDPDVVPDSGP
jgi:hypothetical protein